MVVRIHDADDTQLEQGQFAGFRMSADEFFELPDDNTRYELINGVIVMSPSTISSHQQVANEINWQISTFLKSNRIGRVFYEMDVLLHRGERMEGDFVYKPDVVFVRTGKGVTSQGRITTCPDLVVEVISRGTRRFDTVQKRADYERFGVNEYWIIDPKKQTMTFLRLVDGKFVEIPVNADTFESHAIPGFVLQLAPIREEFKPW